MRKPQESVGSYKTKLSSLIKFLKKDGQGGGQGKNVEALQGGAGQAAKPGQGAQTDCYLNHQTRGAVGRLHPATAGGG